MDLYQKMEVQNIGFLRTCAKLCLSGLNPNKAKLNLLLVCKNLVNGSFMNKKKSSRLKTDIPKPSDLNVLAESIIPHFTEMEKILSEP